MNTRHVLKCLPLRRFLPHNVHRNQSFRTSATSSSTPRIKGVSLSRLTEERDHLSVTALCPAPSCACAEMPTGLDIDYKKPLRGTMPYYTQHIVIRTAQSDWESRIEEGNIGNGLEKKVNLARELKELVGPKGKYHDPYRKILVTNSSISNRGKVRGRDIVLFPQSLMINDVGETRESLEDFAKRFLLPSSKRLSDMGQAWPHLSVTKRTQPTVLICGHGSRDRRCGVLGPLLRDEFRAWATRHGEMNPFHIGSNPGLARLVQRTSLPKGLQRFDVSADTWTNSDRGVGIGLISHIGGHTWAGNVVIYIPPKYRLEDGTVSPMAGKGIWYGRVEPKHVEGIMQETVQQGRVIEELLRGVHSALDAG